MHMLKFHTKISTHTRVYMCKHTHTCNQVSNNYVLEYLYVCAYVWAWNMHKKSILIFSPRSTQLVVFTQTHAYMHSRIHQGYVRHIQHLCKPIRHLNIHVNLLVIWPQSPELFILLKNIRNFRIHGSVCVSGRVFIYMCVSAYVCVHVYICMYIYIYIYIYIYHWPPPCIV
jgi:hypothetical protein